MRSGDDDAGAAAVEFALVLPLLVMLVFGIIEFGLAFNAKIELAGAAREAARTMVVKDDAAAASTIAIQAAPTVCPTVGSCTVTFTSSAGGASCSTGSTMTTTVTRAGWSLDIPLVTDVTFDIAGKAAMRCGG
ncbi:MAG: TadE/TadG family type IV pilus assembly protein [Motilibacteraceae bacterium]